MRAVNLNKRPASLGTEGKNDDVECGGGHVGCGDWSWILVLGSCCLVADERPAHDKTQNKRQFEKEAWSLST